MERSQISPFSPTEMTSVSFSRRKKLLFPIFLRHKAPMFKLSAGPPSVHRESLKLSPTPSESHTRNRQYRRKVDILIIEDRKSSRHLYWGGVPPTRWSCLPYRANNTRRLPITNRKTPQLLWFIELTWLTSLSCISGCFPVSTHRIQHRLLQNSSTEIKKCPSSKKLPEHFFFLISFCFSQ